MQLATEEQKENFKEGLDEILSRNHVSILEALMLFLRAGLAIGVLILSSRIIATPPPWRDGFALILPAPAWGTFLLSTAALSVWGRRRNNLCIRRNGSVGGFIVMTALIGPLSLKAPGLCWVMVLLLLIQAVPAVHLNRQCRGVDPNSPGGGS